MTMILRPEDAVYRHREEAQQALAAIARDAECALLDTVDARSAFLNIHRLAVAAVAVLEGER